MSLLIEAAEEDSALLNCDIWLVLLEYHTLHCIHHCRPEVDKMGSSGRCESFRVTTAIIIYTSTVLLNGGSLRICQH